jgi:hypothetical protein
LNSRGGRNAESQRVHDTAVRLIADHRFQIADWNVMTNPAAEQNDWLEHVDSRVYPDIIARHDDEVVALGEVETSESISDEEAAQWLQLGQLCSRLYLFVPQGTEHEAAKLIQKHGVCCAGLRAYSLTEDNAIAFESLHVPNGHSKWNDHPWWSNVGRSSERDV